MIVIGSIGLFVAYRLFKHCLLTAEEYRKASQFQDMIEMQNIRKEREYTEEAGKILLPQGC